MNMLQVKPTRKRQKNCKFITIPHIKVGIKLISVLLLINSSL